MLRRFAAGALALVCLAVPARAACVSGHKPADLNAFAAWVDGAGGSVIGARHGSEAFIAELRPALPAIGRKPATWVMILDRRDGRWLVVFRPPGSACALRVPPASAADTIISTWMRDRS